jgi:asparaginyl-tRNA synthetase
MSMRVSVKKALQSVAGDKVVVQGWVRSVRAHKNVTFVEINDGSSFGSIQVVTENNSSNRVATGASVHVHGTLAQGRKQTVEIQAKSIDVVGECDPGYPLQKKGHSMEFLRSMPHLRSRSNTFGAMLRVRNAATRGIHDFFEDEGFIQVHTPILTANDAEGAGELFEVRSANEGSLDNDKATSNKFFGERAFLTVCDCRTKRIVDQVLLFQNVLCKLIKVFGCAS